MDADRANAIRAHAGLMTAKPPWLVLLYFTPSDKSDVFKINISMVLRNGFHTLLPYLFTLVIHCIQCQRPGDGNIITQSTAVTCIIFREHCNVGGWFMLRDCNVQLYMSRLVKTSKLMVYNVYMSTGSALDIINVFFFFLNPHSLHLANNFYAFSLHYNKVSLW